MMSSHEPSHVNLYLSDPPNRFRRTVEIAMEWSSEDTRLRKSWGSEALSLNWNGTADI
jgi:hypothetical protein